MSEHITEAVSAFVSARGYEPRGPFLPLLSTPPLLNAIRNVGDQLRFNGTLPASIREFTILIVSTRWQQLYEWDAHYPLAIAAGISEAAAEAIRSHDSTSIFSEEQGLLWSLASELLETGSASSANYEASINQFGYPGTVEIISLIGYYTLMALLLSVPNR